MNVSFSNNGFGANKLLGFNITYKYQDGFYYQGDFASGNIPSTQTLDAQFSFKCPKTKSNASFPTNNNPCPRSLKTKSIYNTEIHNKITAANMSLAK